MELIAASMIVATGFYAIAAAISQRTMYLEKRDRRTEEMIERSVDKFSRALASGGDPFAAAATLLHTDS